MNTVNELSSEVQTFSARQKIFMRYFTAVLTDLVVLGLFNQYWDRVVISSFTIMLAAALLLQLLLKLTMVVEHKVAERISRNHKTRIKLKRGLATWGILFFSKLLILELIELAFGNDFNFIGNYHGLFPFIILVIAIFAAEALVAWVFNALADSR